MKILKNILAGMLVGIANVIPGVSGGTMAVILDVYDELIHAISLRITDLKKNVFFLVTFGAGAVIGIILFSKVLEYLYTHYRIATNFCFIGLIIGSIPMIYRRARKGKGNLFCILSFSLTLAVMIFIAVYSDADFSNNLITKLTLPVFFWLFAVTAFSTFAMILPGISGSFVMLVLGAYSTVIGALSNFNWMILLPVGLGVIMGLLAGTGIVRFLLDRFPQVTYFAILGLVIGSVFPIYPGFQWNAEGFVAILLLIVSTGIAWFFSVADPKRKKERGTGSKRVDQ